MRVARLRRAQCRPCPRAPCRLRIAASPIRRFGVPGVHRTIPAYDEGSERKDPTHDVEPDPRSAAVESARSGKRQCVDRFQPFDDLVKPAVLAEPYDKGT